MVVDGTVATTVQVSEEFGYCEMRSSVTESWLPLTDHSKRMEVGEVTRATSTCRPDGGVGRVLAVTTVLQAELAAPLSALRRNS